MVLEDRLDPKEGCAFLVGNGINRYKNTEDKNWKTFLRDVFPEIKDKVDEKIVDDLLSLTCDLLLLETDKTEYQKRNDVVDNLKSWGQTEAHKTLVKYARGKGCPILTTNYDQAFIMGDEKIEKNIGKNKDKSLVCPFHLSGVPYTKRRYMPFDCYYADEKLQLTGNPKDDIKKQFAIWHIHGTMYYKESMCLSLQDYARQIKNMNDAIKQSIRNRENNIPYSDDSFCIENTWLDIFLNSNLIIFGFNFDLVEMDLYWLLLKRYRRQHINGGKELKTYYIYTEEELNDKDEEKEKEKKNIMELRIKRLKTLNVECILNKSFEEIYTEYKIFTND